MDTMVTLLSVGGYTTSFKWDVRSELSEQIGELLVACAKAAGKPFDFKVALDSSYSIGTNWSETH
jgi:hypothetical protein